MRLKSLEINGFKSFAERTEIVFNQGITGIVGPNGSGKSNIGDAVRWVLGEQSARVLRGAKMEDVIFGGTAKRKAASYCEVSLLFDNEDLALKTSFAEVVVTRRVYRNGDSEYYLNKSACRLRDILELFRDTGIGREGYSLIGQGRIDEILSVKSEDRRQVFEEAAGVMTFRVRKEEAERKLARTKDNLSRVHDILDELASRLTPLSAQSALAKEYLELADRLKTLEIQIFLIRFDKARERVDALQKTIDGLNDLLLSHEARLSRNAAEREELDGAIALLEDELARAREEHMRRNESAHETQSRRERAEIELSSLSQDAERLKGEREDARRRREDLAALLSRGGREADDGAQALEKAQSELDAGQKLLDEALAAAQTDEEALDRHKADILAAVNRMSDARNQRTRQETVCAQMREQLTRVEDSKKELSARQFSLIEALRAAEKQQADEMRLLDTLKNDAAEREGALRAFTAEAQAKAEAAQSLNLEIQANTSRLRVMDEMSREMAGYNQAVKRAVEYAGSDPHVHGVVARLIQVPAAYETAVDLALGSALQNIVTDDEETAKRIIDHLRVNRLGRATFLPMTSVRSRVLTGEERRLLSMDGCLGVASELISFAPAYRGVIENLLGRTVIARDLDAGIPIMRAARHQFRLVTLAGDVMNPGGSMSGGTAQRSDVSLLGRERAMKELRVRLDEQRNTLARARDELTGLQAKREELKRLRNEAMERVHQEDIGAAREQERVFNARAELTAHNDRLQKTEAAAAQLREGIAEIERDLIDSEKIRESENVDREAMDRKTEALQKTLADSRARAEAQRDRVTRMRLQFAELSHALDTVRRDEARRDQELRALDDGIVKLGAALAARERAIDEAKRQAAAFADAYEDIKKALDEKQAAVEALNEKRQATMAKQRECARENDDIHRAFDEDTAKLHRAEIAQTKADADLKSMTDHMFNTYDMTYADADALRSEEKFDLTGGEREAQGLRARIRDMGVVNVGAIEEYDNTKRRFDELNEQKDDLEKAEIDLESLIARLLSQMEKLFVQEFQKLDLHFRETFARLFGGGQAELKLTDPDDALNCGIEIIAQPPGKKLQLLSLLSGGERALTAIAILFAMLKLKPTPFCILDEIEAALDEANIGYFADYLAEYAKTTQFVVITHRKGTMERCDALFGVAMEERGISRMVSVNLEDFE